MKLLCRLGLHKTKHATCVDPDFKVRDYMWCERDGCKYFKPRKIHVEDVPDVVRKAMEQER